MPSSPVDRFPLSDNSSHNFDCASNVPSHYDEESESEMKKISKYRISPGHALLHKQLQKPIILQAKSCGKRRFTFSGQQEHKVIKKRRRFTTTVVPPKKFLLGGNITDPLNLGSLQDEKINQQLNAFSPAQSPMPLPTRRNRVQLIIPPNINDPLNLNDRQDIEVNLLSAKPRKRRRHRKGRREDEDPNQISDELPSYVISEEYTLFCLLEDCVEKILDLSSEQSVSVQPSVEVTEKLPSPSEVKKSAARKLISRARKRIESMKYRKNAKKFCYGNRITSQSNWNFGDEYAEDPRLNFLDENLFRGKNILDIGCNTGELTLHIAMHWQPRKIVGIDIDKKLINQGQKKVRLHLNLQLESEENFPESMAVMYGPLSKLAKSVSLPADEFPNNIFFFEANYVPACEDYLETQKPEYDTILCLRVTKWIHLNFGDEGLKMAFKRMYAQLRYGGHMILEPQPWFTYSASKRITPAIYSTYHSLQMRPESFCDYLLSDEVGFSSCQVIGRTFHCTKTYRQDIYLFTKGYQTNHDQNLLYNTMSPIPFHYDMWTRDISEDYSDYLNAENMSSDM